MPGKSLRILIVGGYGVFGSRLTRILADEEGLALLVAGRSTTKAQAFCRSLAGPATVLPAFLDRNADNVAAAIAALHPDIVVDAAGPFQAYGKVPYRMVEASLALGVDYIDLADATDFVCGIGAFDSAAQKCDRFVISGASTFPALTGAVIRHLATDLVRLIAIEAGIAHSDEDDHQFRPIACQEFRLIATKSSDPWRPPLGIGWWCQG
ncbi:MAG: saccharopine dehydrogenase NADP-binding domain-containing protein, partial [Alphaproteobacteria bacterium]|nr:saccharopine dehydrogenase NADP-binding domain-containing protein [Alphaproteobacteria bacterium]